MAIKLVGASAVTIGEINVSVTTTTLPVTEYTAGETIEAKSVVCVGESDGKIYKAKADSWTTMPAIGITRGAVDTDEIVEVFQVGKVSNVRREADFGYDDRIFVSPDTAGKLTKTPPEGVGELAQAIGRAISANDIALEIDHTVIEITP